MRRGQRDGERIAGAVAGLVQRQLDLVRARIQATVFIVPAPAGAERVTRGQPARRVEDVQAVFAPFHREIDLGIDAAHIERARVLVFEAPGEVVIPVIVGVVPVVVAQLSHQRDLQALCRLRLAIGIHAGDFEARRPIGIGAVSVVEQRPHADQGLGRPQHALEGAGDRAPAGFVHAAGDDRGNRADRLGLVRQCDVFAQDAVATELGVDHVLGFARQLQRGVAEEPAGQRFKRMLLDADCQLGGETVASGRCAVQIRGIDHQLERLAGAQDLLRAVQVQLHALGQELFHAHGHALHGVLAGRIGAEFHLPAAGRRIGRNLLGEFEIALLARQQFGLAEGLAVRLLQAQEHRLRLGRFAVVVAQDRRHPHGFAGAIQIATGPGEHIEPRALAPGHGELAQIQCRLVERQQRNVGLAACGQHMAGVERVVEQRIAVAVGRTFQEQLALGVEDAQLHVLDRLAALQRGGVDEQLVLVGARMQADVADGKERGVEFVFETAGALHHREIQTRFLQLLDVLRRQVGQHAFVLLAAKNEAIDVHRVGQLGQRLVAAVLALQIPAAAAPATLELLEECRQRFFAHAQELDIHLRHVHRHHRQATALARRQHAALRSEPGHRLEFAGVDLLLERLAQAAAVGGQQVGVDQYGVVLGRFDVRVAQRLAVLGQRPAAVARADLLFEAHQRIEILRTDQRPREFQCQRQAVAGLVGIGTRQRETGDGLLVGLDRLAACRGQLTAFVALARHRADCHDQQHRPQQHPPCARPHHP